MVSKGEEKIEKILKSNRVSFQREICFTDLVGKKKVPLRFDFGIFARGRLICCIEFDGRQHFEYTPYFHKSYNDFTKQKARDRSKNAYCLKNRIPLIRIPYWELEDISLEKILNTPSFRVVDKFHNDDLIKYRK